MSIDDAIAEIDRVKGSQLDKDYSEQFIKFITEKIESVKSVIYKKE